MSVALLTALASSTAAAGYLSPALARVLGVRRLQEFCRRNRTLVLTFDDGPGPVLTTTLLDLLRTENALATFFPTGFRTTDYPYVLDLLQADGHEIGCHTHHHTNAWRVMPWQAVRDMKQGFDTLEPWVEPDGLFRPPYGKVCLPTAVALWARSSQLGWWTIDSHDTRPVLPTPSTVLDRVSAAGGGVVLLHDFDRGPDRHAFVIETASDLLQLARQEGWRVRKLGDVLKDMKSERTQPRLVPVRTSAPTPALSTSVDLSIIVVSWNTRNLLRACLDSIRETATDVSLEVLVVDNNSDDGSAEMVECEFTKARLIRNERNVGFARANNQAIAMAQGRSVLLLNSDTEVKGEVLRDACRYMDQHQDVGVLGVRVLNPDGSLQPTCFQDPSLVNQVLLATGLHRLDWPRFLGRERMRHWKRDTERDVDVVSGCFLMARTSALHAVGLLDEQFFFFDEEADWCARFRQAGWRVRFAPVGEITHHGGASVARLSEPKGLLLAKARVRLQYKRGGRLAALATWLVFLFAVVWRATAHGFMGLMPGQSLSRIAASQSTSFLRNFSTVWPRDLQVREQGYRPILPSSPLRAATTEPESSGVAGTIGEPATQSPDRARAA